MGNRAVIETEKRDQGIYLHWNGGRDSVEAFLAYCELRGYQSPERNPESWKFLAHVASTFLEDEPEVEPVERLDEDNWDNGVYVIRNWRIVDRLYFDTSPTTMMTGPYNAIETDVTKHEQYSYPLSDVLREINEAQPKVERIPEEWIDAYVSDFYASLLPAEKRERFEGQARYVLSRLDQGIPDYDADGNEVPYTPEQAERDLLRYARDLGLDSNGEIPETVETPEPDGVIAVEARADITGSMSRTRDTGRSRHRQTTSRVASRGARRARQSQRRGPQRSL